ncbi:MAG: hydrogenase, partial [Bdellovibrionales bacterium]|nr:hydrogenase [Bdellovibrionales bacterium]
MIKREPLVLGNKSYKDITDDICKLVETWPGGKYLATLLTAKMVLVFYLIVMGTIVATGMGLMG